MNTYSLGVTTDLTSVDSFAMQLMYNKTIFREIHTAAMENLFSKFKKN